MVIKVVFELVALVAIPPIFFLSLIVVLAIISLVVIREMLNDLFKILIDKLASLTQKKTGG